MPAPPLLDQRLYCGVTTVNPPNVAQIKELRNTTLGSDNLTTSAPIPQGTSVITFRPGAATTATNDPRSSFVAAGWILPLANCTPADSRGRTMIPAGSLSVIASITASNSAVVLGTPTAALYAGIYRYAPGTATNRGVVASGAKSAQNITAGAIAGSAGTAVTNTLIITIPDPIIFERDEVPMLLIGGSFVAPSGTLGSNTTTFVLVLNNITGVQWPSPGLRTFYVPAAYLADAAGVALRSLTASVAHTLDAFGSGTVGRQLTLFRSFLADGAGQVLGQTKKLLITHTANGRAGAVEALTRIIKKAMLVPAAGVATRAATVRKTLTGRGRGAGTLARLWDAFRAFAPVGVGKPADLVKHVVFVRYFLASARPRIRTRLTLDWDDLPDAGAGGIIKKVALYLFDD